MPTWAQLGVTDVGRETQRRYEVAARAVAAALGHPDDDVDRRDFRQPEARH
jgi:hypothetical protein